VRNPFVCTLSNLLTCDDGCQGAVWAGFLCAIFAWMLMAPFVFVVSRAATRPLVTRMSSQVAAEVNIGKKYSI
jgi:hypothetical protein